MPPAPVHPPTCNNCLFSDWKIPQHRKGWQVPGGKWRKFWEYCWPVKGEDSSHGVGTFFLILTTLSLKHNCDVLQHTEIYNLKAKLKKKMKLDGDKSIVALPSTSGHFCPSQPTPSYTWLTHVTSNCNINLQYDQFQTVLLQSQVGWGLGMVGG